MHGGPGELARCRYCGVTVRREQMPASYDTDKYDLAMLDVLYPRYRRAFARRARRYFPLLSAGAEVLEIGCHTGAFLEVAECCGWRPTGLDIGEDTSRYAARRGLHVIRNTLHEARLAGAFAEALFIWNCFEQMEDPLGTLREAHRFLRDDALLIVRVPNLAFYERQRRRRAYLALVHQNLLGFPYQLGYTPATLSAVLRSGGFEIVSGHDCNLLISPFPELTQDVKRERRTLQVDERARPPERLSGPWIELVGRRRREGRGKTYVY